MKNYKTRLIEPIISQQLKIMGGVLIEGPKWSGKSTTGALFAKTIVKLQDPSVFSAYKMFSLTDKIPLLDGEKPLMFDEWQKIPEIWDYIRMDIDDTNSRGRYILTGSAKPVKDVDRHTGTGRIVKIKMRPMSLYESKHSNGGVSLLSLFDNEDISLVESKLTIFDLADLICRGGWPGSLDLDINEAIIFAKNYYLTLTSEDIVGVDGVKRDAKRTRLILKSFSRNIAAQTPYTTIINDIRRNDENISSETFYSYIRALEQLFIIDNVSSWSPNLRSKASIRTTDKRQLIDPSLGAAAIGAYPKDLLNDVNTFGLLFESLCLRDLSVYIEALSGEISHYRDSDGLEVDAIVHLSDGRWGAIEIKLGGDNHEKGAKNLLSLKNKVDEIKEPSFLMILTGTKQAYKRKDGVFVIPIGCLKP